MTHEQLVQAAAKWLKRVWRAPVVATELVTSAMETPDAIGWTSGGRSVVAEAKISVADFRADRKKTFRKFARMGVGDYRYFITPPGLLRGELLPDGWGLLEVGVDVRILVRSHASDCYCIEARELPSSDPRAIAALVDHMDADEMRSAKKATARRHIAWCSPAFKRKAHECEALMLMSICRRLAGPCGIRGRTTVDIAAYEKDEKGRKIQMNPMRAKLNAHKWQTNDLDLVTLVVLHRGAPNDEAFIHGPEIVKIQATGVLLEGEEGAFIPYHRIQRIDVRTS